MVNTEHVFEWNTFFSQDQPFTCLPQYTLLYTLHEMALVCQERIFVKLIGNFQEFNKESHEARLDFFVFF